MASDEGRPGDYPNLVLGQFPKADWIKDALGKIREYQIDGFVWFNINKSEDGRFTRWTVDSSPESLAAFKAALP